MIWFAIKCLLSAALLFFVYKMTTAYIEVRKMQAAGVYYTSSFPPIMDTINLIRATKKYPYKFGISALVDMQLEDITERPKIIGVNVLGMHIIMMGDPNLIEDMFIKQNPYYTKHEMKREGGKPMLTNNIVAMDTFDPQYAPKRKALSSAFFKNKV